MGNASSSQPADMLTGDTASKAGAMRSAPELCSRSLLTLMLPSHLQAVAHLTFIMIPELEQTAFAFNSRHESNFEMSEPVELSCQDLS